jgi:hypothetical protein
MIALLGIDAAQLAAIDADKLEKLVGLYERHAARMAADAYSQAMQACQGEMPSVLRTKKGENSKYAPLEGIHEVIKPVYLRHGFSLSFGELPPTDPGQCNLYCDVRHTGGHTERHTLQGGLDTSGPKGGATKTPIQGKGSTTAYLRRYLTVMIFNLTIENEDRDGQARHQLVGADEIRQINELIDECQQVGKPVKVDKFVAWLGVESLEQLTMLGFSKAVWELNRKRRLPKKAETAKA